MAVATTTTPTTARPDRAPSAGSDVRSPRSRGGRRTLGVRVGFALDAGGGPGPQVARRFGRLVAQLAQQRGGRRRTRRRPRDTPRSRRDASRATAPRRLPSGASSRSAARAGRVMWRRPGIGRRRTRRTARTGLRGLIGSPAMGVAAAASAARSEASAWRRLSRARVRSARAATWLTPSAAASSSPVRSCSSARRSAARWRSGMRAERALHVAGQVRVHDQALGRRRGPRRFAGPRQEPDDLAAADLVERHAMGDLVEPGAGVLGLLERLVVPVGLDERVLGQVGGQLGLAKHPQQVGVDLAVVPAEERLDEDGGLVAIPDVAHGDTSRTVDGAAEGFAKVSEGQIGDHKYSERVLVTEHAHEGTARARRPNDDGTRRRVTPDGRGPGAAQPVPPPASSARPSSSSTASSGDTGLTGRPVPSSRPAISRRRGWISQCQW